MKLSVSPKLRCPSCHGDRLVVGEQVWNFAPKGKWVMLGFAIYSAACLDCGHIIGCLSDEDRRKLEKKVQDA
jgi:hypothetical protein